MKKVTLFALVSIFMYPCYGFAASLGAAISEKASQVNLAGAFGNHILLGGVNFYESGKTRARTRYLNLQEGMSYTAGFIFDREFTVATAGLMYNIKYDTGLIVSPMLTAGYNPYRDPNSIQGESGTTIVQPGVFIQWTQQAGRLYANPKSTYFKNDDTWVPQLELGGDVNIGKNTTTGIKVDYTGSTKLTGSGSTTFWLRVNYGF